MPGKQKLVEITGLSVFLEILDKLKAGKIAYFAYESSAGKFPAVLLRQVTAGSKVYVDAYVRLALQRRYVHRRRAWKMFEGAVLERLCNGISLRKAFLGELTEKKTNFRGYISVEDLLEELVIAPGVLPARFE